MALVEFNARDFGRWLDNHQSLFTPNQLQALKWENERLYLAQITDDLDYFKLLSADVSDQTQWWLTQRRRNNLSCFGKIKSGWSFILRRQTKIGQVSDLFQEKNLAVADTILDFRLARTTPEDAPLMALMTDFWLPKDRKRLVLWIPKMMKVK